MASPQLEDGIQIPNELAEAFARIRISGEEWQVLWVIIRKGKMNAIPISQFANATGISRGGASRALRGLLRKKAIVKKDTPIGVSYGVQGDYGKWRPVPKKTRGTKKGKPPSPKKTTMDAALKRSFDIFWPVYPRKVAKKRALKAWLKIKPDEELVEKIVDAVKAHAKTDQWTKEDGHYIPHPASWLNDARWNDVIETKQAKW